MVNKVVYITPSQADPSIPYRVGCAGLGVWNGNHATAPCHYGHADEVTRSNSLVTLPRQ